ncbi:hypothetical protein [Lysobacter firmicutimachus]|uniref:Uncharacterized protein n=1 Tax=Lysobacter firmicutimachus TaxID=1792846 RepID=A0ABU8CXK1_9GAMM
MISLVRHRGAGTVIDAAGGGKHRCDDRSSRLRERRGRDNAMDLAL